MIGSTVVVAVTSEPLMNLTVRVGDAYSVESSVSLPFESTHAVTSTERVTTVDSVVDRTKAELDYAVFEPVSTTKLWSVVLRASATTRRAWLSAVAVPAVTAPAE